MNPSKSGSFIPPLLKPKNNLGEVHFSNGLVVTDTTLLFI